MINENVKRNFINFLENRGEYFRKVHEGQYRIRCPFCGDTQKNFNEGHLYIKAEFDNDYNIAYNCFKCGEHGYLNQELIELLGCDIDLKNDLLKMSKSSKSYVKNTGELLYFDFKTPDVDIEPRKLKYIDGRMGIDFTIDDYENLKVVTSLYDFLATNNIKDRPFNNDILNLLQRDYVGFLSNGNSHILFRDITDRNRYSWIKYPITKESSINNVFYSIRQNPIDILTKDDIIINLSEGVFDAIGIGYHLKQMNHNTMNIAICGKQYREMLSRLLNMGLVGSNIIVNIFSDNDNQFNEKRKKNNYRTDFESLRFSLKSIRPLYKKIILHHNLKSKDYGVPKKDIAIKKMVI